MSDKLYWKKKESTIIIAMQSAVSKVLSKVISENFFFFLNVTDIADIVIVDMLNIDILLTFSGYLFYWNFVSGQHTTAV